MLNVKLGRANELAFPSVAERCFFTLPSSLKFISERDH